MPKAWLKRRASSPIVMPCRIGIGNCPTNELHAVCRRRTLDLVAANRVGTIADNHRQSAARRGTQAVRHRVDVGVDPRPDILEIDDEHVEPREHVGRRLTRVAVEREHRHLAQAVLAVRGLDHVVLQVRAEAMLRPEERRQRDVRIRMQPIGGVRQAAVDRGRVADQTDAAAGNQTSIDGEQAIDAGCDDLAADDRGNRHNGDCSASTVSRPGMEASRAPGSAAGTLRACGGRVSAPGGRRRAHRRIHCTGSGGTFRGRA